MRGTQRELGHRLWGPVGSPVGRHAAGWRGAPFDDTGFRSTLRRHPRTLGRTAAWRKSCGPAVGRGGDGLGRSQVGFLPAQEGAQGGWRLDRAVQGAGCPPSAQHVGIVNAVAASSADATRVMTLSPVLARPGASPRSGRSYTSWGRPMRRAKVGVGAALHWPPGGDQR